MSWPDTTLTGIEEGFKNVSQADKTHLCTMLHRLLDIIGNDPNYKKEIARACNLLSSNNCPSHSACSSQSDERRGKFG